MRETKYYCCAANLRKRKQQPFGKQHDPFNPLYATQAAENNLKPQGFLPRTLRFQSETKQTESEYGPHSNTSIADYKLSWLHLESLDSGDDFLTHLYANTKHTYSYRLIPIQ